ncbi:toprim domain-containing protein, partial [Candidatus Pacearchaeota archaeon]|nr:toprim domain-containing protein [Candidatus Pacearchaeota archaeon]
IIVEGRADVINMLKHGIKNVIGMQGTHFPKTITKLGEEKELTLFVDGDRGGNLIAQNVCDNAKVVYIAQAPDGKEVEELAGKELLQALRKKVIAKDFFKKTDNNKSQKSYDQKPRFEEPVEKIERRNLNDDDISKLRELTSEIKGNNVLVLNENLEVVKNVPASRLSSVDTKEAFALMVSNATGTVIQAAERLQSKVVAAKTFGKIPETNIKLISL